MSQKAVLLATLAEMERLSGGSDDPEVLARAVEEMTGMKIVLGAEVPGAAKLSHAEMRAVAEAMPDDDHYVSKALGPAKWPQIVENLESMALLPKPLLNRLRRFPLRATMAELEKTSVALMAVDVERLSAQQADQVKDCAEMLRAQIQREFAGSKQLFSKPIPLAFRQ